MAVTPCILCNKSLESVIGDRPEELKHNQPHGGTSFETRGHYGSSVIDDDGRTMKLIICDPCVVEQMEQGTILVTTAEIDERR